MKVSGHALHEYAFALALLAIVSIASLISMGHSITNLFGHFTGTQTTTQLDNYYSLVGVGVQAQAATPGKTSSVTAANASSSAATTKRYVFTVDPATGQIVIHEIDSTGANVTSVDGHVVISESAQALAALANFKDANGNSLPKDIQNLLLQLAATGQNMSADYGYLSQNMQNIVLQNSIINGKVDQGQYVGPPFYDKAAVDALVGIGDQHLVFSQLFDQLTQQLNTLAPGNPEIQALQEKVNNYAGSISGLTYSNITDPLFSQFHIGFVSQSDLNSALQANPSSADAFKMLKLGMMILPPATIDRLAQEKITTLSANTVVGTSLVQGNTPVSFDIDLATTPTSLAATP